MQRRPCWVEISTRSFEDNYRSLNNACDACGGSGDGVSTELLAIVKANAYGHGLALCAPAAVRAGARWLGVTSVEEGVAARVLCPESEILVISGPFPEQGPAVLENRLTAVVWESWQLEELDAAARAAGHGSASVPIHLELDTGMSRQGVGLPDLEIFLDRLASHACLRLDGLMTHLYAADESDGEVTRKQLGLLEAAVEQVHARGLRPTWMNVGNSAAVVAGEVPVALRRLHARWGLRPLMRPGLALYGLAPEFAPEEPASVAKLRAELEPVLAWKTQVVSVRTLEAGQAVGYNGTFVATEPMRVALLAAGYGDGLNRKLSNRGSVLVAGQRAPIVGRISMDQMVVDVTEIADVQHGDEAVLLGRQGSECIPAEEHAALAGTIPWEIFTSITSRVERRAV